MPRRTVERADDDRRSRIADDATPDVATQKVARSILVRLVWVLGGLVCVGIGAIGIVVPGLPSTVFFIAAAACFSRSSPRLEAWVMSLPAIGPAVRDYRAGLGMPRRAKIVAVAMIVVFVSLSIFLIDGLVLRVALGVAGVVGVVVVLRVRTSDRSRRAAQPDERSTG